MLNKVLIIWSDVPDAIADFIVIETEQKVSKFHGNYINGMGDLELEKEMLKFFYDEDWNFKFARTKEPIKGSFDLIVQCGSVL